MTAKILPFRRPKPPPHPIAYVAANYIIGITMVALIALAWIETVTGHHRG